MTLGSRRRRRRGAAAVEMAVLLPVFLAVALGTVDFAMLFRRATAVLDCATEGAAAGAGLGSSAGRGDRDAAIRAAVADAATAAGLAPAPSVDWTPGTDAVGLPYIDVTVTHTPDGPVGILWHAGGAPIARKVRMMLTP